jgi:restriction system protein
MGQAPTHPTEAMMIIQVLRETLADELLERVKGCSPEFFERLVVQLLVAMGYGGSLADAGQAVGKAGDGGIDGIIKEDKLGLDVVCIQAKRWEGKVGRPAVQAFAGSMEAYRARKGVLITTSGFSDEATDYVTRIERKIVLIDGPTLAELMIEHNIGVSTARSYAVKKIDSDYFTEEEP